MHCLNCSLPTAQLDVQIPSALQKRKTCSCPPLPHVDPRVDYRITRDFVDSLNEEELDHLRQVDDADKPTVIRDLVEKKNAEQVKFMVEEITFLGSCPGRGRSPVE